MYDWGLMKDWGNGLEPRLWRWGRARHGTIKKLMAPLDIVALEDCSRAVTTTIVVPLAHIAGRYGNSVTSQASALHYAAVAFFTFNPGEGFMELAFVFVRLAERSGSRDSRCSIGKGGKTSGDRFEDLSAKSSREHGRVDS